MNEPRDLELDPEDLVEEVAIVGMAGRFPGAPGLEEFWCNLRDGVESISTFTEAELLAGGVAPGLLAHPRYVRARGVLAGADLFDAPFFGLSPREAAITDPQQRVFLECAWEALEQAGIDPDTCPGRIGVYAGSLLSTYLLFHLLPRVAAEDAEGWQMVLANDKDTLSTRVSYKLNLRGPSVTVQSACSTALVAVHMARQSLLDYECDVALAGGVAIRSPQTVGYLYQEEGILSPDGHCRAFDAQARGTVFSSGAGLVVLKRLSEALADGDTVRAVLKGSAVNNDGAHKAGFTAPSLDGQAEVVARALALAGVSPETVSYVEAHGTGTPLGDPIEIAALTRAFRAGTRRRGFCAVGSVKTNIGHLDTAAGIAGLIKTVLALEHRQIPPTLHFERPNPRIELVDSPFYVADRLLPWDGGEGPRRAGVSSLGIGGTNAHVVVEEAPPAAETSPPRAWQLLVLSAKTETALESVTGRLDAHLRREPGQDLADVAFTLQAGRRALPWRRALVCSDREDALEALARRHRFLDGRPRDGSPAVAFLFPGQGSQRPGMGRELYAAEPAFRREVDRCAEILRPHLGEDLRNLLFPVEGRREEAARRLDRTSITQPALFVVETALARLWMSWGVSPQALLGHSVGEYVAAHIAGVISLEDALALVAARGRLVEELPGGAMLAVPLPEPEVTTLLGSELSLAAVNGPLQCVLSGPEDAIEELREELARRGVEGRRLPTSHAFHSRQMEALLEPFARRVGQVSLHPPDIPFLSNVTGGWITPEEATDPAYWARHLRRTVRFADGLEGLLAEPDRVLLEVGPGRALTRLARRLCDLRGDRERVAVPSLPGEEGQPELAALYTGLGRLWTAGVTVDWTGFHAGEHRRRVPLPTYPFERKSHWIEPVQAGRGAAPGLPEEPETTLHLPQVAVPTPAADPLPADDPLALRIGTIWREVLGMDRVGFHASFFDLGGDSLIALRLMARLREAFAVDLPVRALFDRPTVSGLRDAVASALAAGLERGDAPPCEAPAIGRRPDAGPAPLSSSQQRLWLLDRMAPGHPAYNIHSLARLSGPLDRQSLRHAFAEIVRRHEVLRTLLREEDGRPVQVALPRVDLALPWVDLSALPAERRQAEAIERAREEAGRGFDLGSAPLMRVLLLGLDDGDHFLVLTLHHAISDGWSMGVLLRELAALYEAFASGGSSPLAPLPLQYADFAVWQRQRLAEGAFAPELDFWLRQLRGAPQVLELPADRLRPAVQTLRGAALQVSLAPEAAMALAALARLQGATLFMALLAVFQTLLLRYCGQEDLLVGTPVAGRGRKELEGLIGLFVDTLVLRGDLDGDPSFRELLERVRRTCLEAYAHQELPLELLIEELQPDRDLGRNPLFQVMFALQNTPLPEVAASGLALRQEDLESGTAMFDLAFSLREREGTVSGSLRYSTDLFDGPTAGRLLAHFASLLTGAAAEPERRLSELSLLTPEERRQLAAWNDRMAPLRRDACLHERFAAWAVETPEAPAVVCGAEVVSYGELDRRANQLARRLRRLGVGPEVPVGLCAGRSPEMVAGLLGILKAGGAYVPLDESYPPERLALMVEDSGASVLVVHGRRAGELAPEGTPVLDLGAGWGEIAGEDGAPPGPSGAAPEGLAYVIYTSGSTGRPKGVGCTHLAVVNLLTDLERRRPLLPGEGCSLWTSISFDVSVWEIFSALCFGGALHIPSEGERASAEALFPWMARHRIRSAYLPPFLLADFAAWVREGGDERRSLARLLVGVEPIRERLLADIASAVPELRIINGYGPTEATVCATFYDVGERPVPERRTPLGLPLANCRVHLLDPHFQEVPVGAPGEIWIGGAGLARGYLGRPDLTAERFVPDPIGGPGAEPGARCYRSGDVARRLPGGDLEFLGRRDHQVKVRGFRIELGEIEAALGLLPGVREAVVAVREDPRGDRHLVAYIVPHPEGSDVSSWRESLGRRLPAPMLPSAFVLLPALPMAPSDKVDRRALPDPDWSSSRLEGGFVPPRGPVETLLAGIWSQLLGGGPVSATDTFFALGGHSLLATRVVSRVRELFAVDLPLREIFETRTLAGLAERIEALRREGGAAAPPQPTPQPRTGPLPLSFAQQRLWFMDQFEPGSVLFNTPGALRLSGPLSPALLGRTLNEVVRRHEVLRTTFRAVHGQPVQVIAAELTLPLPVLDLARLPPRRRNEEVERRIADEIGFPFDLAAGPLLRATLLRLEPCEHVLLLNLHHIAGDRWSLGIFRREIAALYDAWSRGEPSPLPELPLQYADFALWQRRWLTGEVLEAELEHWRRQLAGAPHVLDLPADRPRPRVQSFRGRSLPASLPAELVARLTSWGQQRGGTLFMTLLAALAALLGRSAGQEDLLVGSPIAGRDHRELEGLIGMFVNTLVLRVDLSGNPGFELLLDRVRGTALEAYAHQALPFERLVDEIAPVRDLGRSPLFQVAFALQNVPTEPLRLSGLTLTPLPVDNGTAQQDLLLLLAEEEGGLAGVWEYSTDLFDATTIQRLAGHFTTLLSTVACGAAGRLSELPLLSPAERQQIWLEWNDTQSEHPRERGLHELFAAWAEELPAAPAVVGEGTRWSYGRLDEAANRLAWHLRSLGVGPEARVGVAVERSPELITGLLGILKAGAAYVPLDPGYPDERLAFMIADTGAPVVLVHGRTRDRIAGLPVREGAAPHLVCLDADRGPRAGGSAPPPYRGSATELAYVTYTSGSTGRPKGVAVPHQAVVRLVRGTDYVRLGRGDRVAHVSNISFDAATFEIWGPLLNGGTVVVIDREVALSPADFAARLREEQVTALFLTTALFNGLVREAPTAFGSLSHLLFGGEAVDPGAVARALGEVAPERLLHVYGPTESTTFALWHEVREVAPAAPTVPIGLPLANTTAYVLDRWGELAPPGHTGELLIGGEGLARCYLNRPELTAERFVPHSWSQEPGARLYRTGDLVRRRPDGAVEFVGRVDHQVKIRGFRIEPAEVEAALAEHPAVQACSAVVREDVPGGKALVAYFVPRPGAASEAQELRAFLAAKLPSYMVPAAFVGLAELPLSHHGKVDRTALPAPQIVSDPGAAAPRTPAEKALAGIWAQVLGREQVGLHDNFFELGGDSILCVQVVSRARQAGLRVTPKDLFEHQTVAELAAVAGNEAPLEEEAGDDIPLTPIQRWFFDLGLEDPHHFNQSLLLALRPAVDAGPLQRAWGEVVRRHAALRFRFSRGERGEWRQTATGTAEPLVARVDLSGLSPEGRRSALERAAGRLQESLDLARGPLLRAVLFTLDQDTQRLLLVLHHLIVDAVSWRVLLAELETVWRSFAAGGEAAAPPPAITFRQWAASLPEQARSATIVAELSYWLEPSRVAVRPLPLDRPGGANTVASVRTVVVELAQEETTALLEEVPRAYGTRMADALLTAMVHAFAGWTGEPRLLVDLEGHGREELIPGMDPSRTVGWFTALFPVLIELDRKQHNPGEILKVVKERLWSVPRGGIGYGLLLHLGDETASARLRERAAAEVLFNYLGELDQGLVKDSLFTRAPESPGPARSPRQRRRHLLEIDAGLLGGRLRLTWAYSESLHERGTIQALADRSATALRELIAHCRSTQVRSFTPADFPEARVSQRDLDKLMTRIGKRGPGAR